MKKIVLASASKRRSEILSSCGIRHDIIVSDVKEIECGEKNVEETVTANAALKAEDIASRVEEALVLGADTLVESDGEVLGKPSGEQAAKDMLRRFSGCDISVFTGICLVDTSTGKSLSAFDESIVRVVSLTEEEVVRSFPLLGPYDKAGGFSIEGVGSMFFDDIRGSYFNVLGLSMVRVRELFKKHGYDILDFVEGPRED